MTFYVAGALGADTGIVQADNSAPRNAIESVLSPTGFTFRHVCCSRGTAGRKAHPPSEVQPKHVAKQEKARTDHRENQSGFLSAMKERILDCRRFCSGRSTKAQQRATKCWALTPTRSTTSTCSPQKFNRVQRGLESGSGPGGRRFKSSLPDHLFSISYSSVGRPTGISPGAVPLETAKTLALSESLRAGT